MQDTPGPRVPPVVGAGVDNGPMTPERAAAVRTVASSLVFDQDPPVVRSLDKARKAAGEIVDALVTAGILPAAYGDYDDLVAANVSGNGAVADVEF